MYGHQRGSCCTPGSLTQPGRAGAGQEGPLPVLNKGCCGGRDYGPVRDEEGPSAADIARFDRDTILCPKCKAEMFDEAELCLSCGHMFVEEDRKGLAPWALATGVVLIGIFTLWIVL